MSMIPNKEPCRFIDIEDIKQRIKDDNFQYKNVRIVAKIKKLMDTSTGYCIVQSIKPRETEEMAEEGELQGNELYVDTRN